MPSIAILPPMLLCRRSCATSLRDGRTSGWAAQSTIQPEPGPLQQSFATRSCVLLHRHGLALEVDLRSCTSSDRTAGSPMCWTEDRSGYWQRSARRDARVDPSFGSCEPHGRHKDDQSDGQSSRLVQRSPDGYVPHGAGRWECNVRQQGRSIWCTRTFRLRCERIPRFARSQSDDLDRGAGASHRRKHHLRLSG